MYNYFIGVLYFQQIKQKILKVMYFENIEESSRFILTINIFLILDCIFVVEF